MEIIMQILIGALSFIAIVLTFYHLNTLITHPEKTLESDIFNYSDTSPWSFKNKIYWAFVIIGSFFLFFKGAEAMLFWMPSNIGSYSEGDYQPLKNLIATGLALFATDSALNGLQNNARELASQRILLKYLKERNQDFESFIQKVSYCDNLADLYEYSIKYAKNSEERLFFEECLEKYKKNLNFHG